MFYIELLEYNDETKIIIPNQLLELICSIQINNKKVQFKKSKVCDNKNALTINGLSEFPTNSFFSMEFLNKYDKKIEVCILESGNFPVKFGSIYGIVSSLNNNILIKFVKLNELFFMLGNYTMKQRLNLHAVDSGFNVIEIDKFDKNKLKHLLIVVRDVQNNKLTYRFYPLLFVDGKAILPKELDVNTSITLINNSTIFEYRLKKINNRSVKYKNLEHDKIRLNQFTKFNVSQNKIYELPFNNFIKDVPTININRIFVENQNLFIKIFTGQKKYINHNFPTFILKKRRTNKIILLGGEFKSEDTISFDFLPFLNETDNKRERWDIYLLGKMNNSTFHLGFQKEYEDHVSRYFKIFNYAGEKKSTYHCYSRLYLTKNDTLALVKNIESNLIKNQYLIESKITNFSMKRSIVNLQVYFNSPYMHKLEIKSLCLVYRNKDSFRKKSFVVNKTNVVNENTYYLECKINLLKVDFTPYYWDIYIGLKIKGDEYFVKIMKNDREVSGKINKSITKYQYNISNNYIVYPYITLNNSLAFAYRRQEYYEKRYYYIKEYIAYIFAGLFRKHLWEKEIWIGYEKLAMSAHDNGYYFFDYVYKNSKHNNFYYVITKDSPEIINLMDKRDKVLYFMSFKYFVYMFSARLLISSDTKWNSYNLKMKKTKLGKILTNKPLVYLQHGVNGLKAVPDFYKKRGVFDLVISPSEYEKEIIVNRWGYDESEVAITGLARWDVLKDKTDEIPYKQIFIMPTWRTWMDGIDKDEFLKSEFYKNYITLLNSTKLHKMLEENNVKIKFFLHPKFKDYINLFNFKSSNIEKFDFLEVPLDEMIMRSSLMISDYSSVIWEMFYLKKPCLFFHFDKEKYLEYEGSYLDFDNELFGDVAFDSDNLMKHISYYIKNEFQEKEIYAKMRWKYFSYMDQNNSKRIYEAVQNSKESLYKKSKYEGWRISNLLPHPIRKRLLKIKQSIFSGN